MQMLENLINVMNQQNVFNNQYNNLNNNISAPTLSDLKKDGVYKGSEHISDARRLENDMEDEEDRKIEIQQTIK